MNLRQVRHAHSPDQWESSKSRHISRFTSQVASIQHSRIEPSYCVVKATLLKTLKRTLTNFFVLSNFSSCGHKNFTKNVNNTRWGCLSFTTKFHKIEGIVMTQNPKIKNQKSAAVNPLLITYHTQKKITIDYGCLLCCQNNNIIFAFCHSMTTTTVNPDYR